MIKDLRKDVRKKEKIGHMKLPRSGFVQSELSDGAAFNG